VTSPSQADLLQDAAAAIVTHGDQMHEIFQLLSIFFYNLELSNIQGDERSDSPQKWVQGISRLDKARLARDKKKREQNA